MKKIYLALFILLITACSSNDVPGQPPPPTLTRARPTLTATSTHTPAPTAANTPTPTPTPPHPLSIEYLRQQDYSSATLVIDQTLTPTWNYNRYIASYQSEGLKLNGYLTVPRGEKPETGWPVIIFNHGYIPPEQYQSTERYIAYVHTFASRGYIVFRPDYRGHANSEGDARGVYGAPDYVIDVLNATSALKTFPDADPDRIGMWGHSMGGYITLRAMVVDPDIKAGVIWGGVIGSYEDMIEYWFNRHAHTPEPDDQNSFRGWRTSLLETFGPSEENPEFWETISANYYLTDLSGPIQLHHATTDESVPHILSEILYQEILDVGGTVEFYSYPGDNHNIANGFSLAMQRSLNFFDIYVKGE